LDARVTYVYTDNDTDEHADGYARTDTDPDRTNATADSDADIYAHAYEYADNDPYCRSRAEGEAVPGRAVGRRHVVDEHGSAGCRVRSGDLTVRRYAGGRPAAGRSC
jgi:hypothetical protein